MNFKGAFLIKHQNKMTKMESPYIENPDRLAKVIAAIQAMATYKFYKLDFAEWSDRIYGHKGNVKELETIFKDHPEFFRLDGDRKKASLVLRRNYPKVYNVDTFSEISKQEFLKLGIEEKKRISRSPLRDEDISMLINTAIGLHEHALKVKQDQRWWISIVLVIIAGAIGLIPFILEKVL